MCKWSVSQHDYSRKKEQVIQIEQECFDETLSEKLQETLEKEVQEVVQTTIEKALDEELEEYRDSLPKRKTKT